MSAFRFPPPRLRQAPHSWHRVAVFGSVLAIALACSESDHAPSPTEPRLAKGGAAAPLTVTPTSLSFVVPPSTAATITAQVQFVGPITATTSSAACATVSPQSVPAAKPPGSAVYVATFTVTPVGPGSCTITLTDKHGDQAVVQVDVQQKVVVIRQETIAPGYAHVCGIATGGAAFCWGANDDNELGNNTFVSTTAPTAVAGGLTFTSVTSGARHSCGLTANGTAYCWGYIGDGALGIEIPPGPSLTSNPAEVGKGAMRFATISAGGLHSCGMAVDGTAYCWGSNANGELGAGTSPPFSSLGLVVAVATPPFGFASIVAGERSTCALTSFGKAYCWGYNFFGQLGDGTQATSFTPVAVGGNLTFASISPGGNHTCGLTTSGAAYCWGANGVGQLGDGTTTQHLLPTAVAGGLVFSRISAGSSHTCAYTATGDAYCWGGNPSGELGDGTTTQRLAPTAVSAGGQQFATVRGGAGFTCGVTTAGAAQCWGSNFFGMLGDGTNTSRALPTAVSGGLTFATP
jgi:alpha-tubulin suppressor-like RCC1 family protein